MQLAEGGELFMFFLCITLSKTVSEWFSSQKPYHIPIQGLKIAGMKSSHTLPIIPSSKIPLQNEAHLNYGRNLTYIISAASHFIGLCADHVRIGYDSIMIIWCPHFVFAWIQLWDVEIIAGRYQKLQVLVLQCQKPPHEVSLKMECETDMCPGRTLQTFSSMI